MSEYLKGYEGVMKVAGIRKRAEVDPWAATAVGGGALAVGAEGVNQLTPRMTPEARQAIKGFKNIPNLDSPKEVFTEYGRLGSKIVREPVARLPSGKEFRLQSLVPLIENTEIPEGVESALRNRIDKKPLARTSLIADDLLQRFEFFKDPDIIEHYKGFSGSPAQAYQQIMREHKYPLQEGLFDKWHNAQDMAEARGVHPSQYRQDLRMAMQEGLNRTDPQHVNEMSDRLENVRRQNWADFDRDSTREHLGIRRGFSGEGSYTEALGQTTSDGASSSRTINAMPEAQHAARGQGMSSEGYYENLMNRARKQMRMGDKSIHDITDPRQLQYMASGGNDALLDYVMTRLDPTLRGFADTHKKEELKVLDKLDDVTQSMARNLPRARNVGLGLGAIGLGGAGVRHLKHTEEPEKTNPLDRVRNLFEQ